jgi:predicted permease
MQPGAAEFRGREDYNILARLKPGITVVRAQAEMDQLTARLRRDFPATYPPNGGLTFSVVPLLEQVVGNVRTALLILIGAVGFVLLIACANVANLLLSRALGRQREITVRSALGATRSRIVQQLLTESVLLAAAGGVAGLLFAFAGIAWLQALQPPNVPRLRDISITSDVLVFTTLLCLTAALLFGLAPAIGMGRLNLQTALRDAGRGSIGSQALWGRGSHLRRLLVMTELALSVVLLIGAGLLIRSFNRLREVPPGFDPANVISFELALTGPKYPNAQAVLNTYQQVWERLEQLPGVEHAGGITSLPLSGYMAWGPITIEGYTPPGGQDFINADQRVAGGSYFQSLQIPLRSGRFFNATDRTDGAPVVVIDEYLAQQYWPGQDAIGKRLRLGPISANSDNWLTVVGVVGRVKQYGFDTDGRIVIYLPQTQFPSRSMYVTIRTRSEPAALAAAVRRELRAIDPDLPMYRTRTMAERVDAALARPRFATTLLTIFAAIALVLASVGIYGVMAYLVSQGTRDIGIRMALGATQSSVLGLVLRQGSLIAAVGLAGGLAGAWALTRFMQSLLFGISGTDALTFAAVATLLAAVAMVATFIPARRAARIDPIVALRAD